MRIGSVYAAKRYCVAVLLTSTCSTIITIQVIAWHLVTGNHLITHFFRILSLSLSLWKVWIYLSCYLSLWGLEHSDLSVWCFSCDAYLDAQVIRQLRPVYETAYLLKFGEAPPSRAV